MEKKPASIKLTAVSVLALFAFLSAGCEGYLGPGWDLGTDLLGPANLQALTEIAQEDRDSPVWIVDVRSELEYNGGHIPTAISRPSTEIASRLGEPPLDDYANYLIVYCETGGRAQMVIANTLVPNGNTRVMNWGGVTKWPYPLE